MLLCSIQTEYENIPLEIGPKMIVHKISSGPEAVTRKCSIKKGVLRNFAEFTGKHLCQSLFFNKVAGLSLQLC